MNLIGLYDNDSITLTEYPVQTLLDRVHDLEIHHIREKGMHLVMSCSMDTLAMDVDLLESLLVNLIDNAIKASKEEDVIDVIATHDRISVRDSGTGIPQEEIPKITEAFYMVDKSRSKKGGGIGLGLALCRQIAWLHHMHLEIQSTLGQGTTVTLAKNGSENPEGRELMKKKVICGIYVSMFVSLILSLRLRGHCSGAHCGIEAEIGRKGERCGCHWSNDCRASAGA